MHTREKGVRPVYRRFVYRRLSSRLSAFVYLRLVTNGRGGEKLPGHGVWIKPHRRSDRLAEGRPPDERERYRLHNENGSDLDSEARAVCGYDQSLEVYLAANVKQKLLQRYGLGLQSLSCRECVFPQSQQWNLSASSPWSADRYRLSRNHVFLNTHEKKQFLALISKRSESTKMIAYAFL
ncbi:MAG: hypothetical protein ACREYE_21605 [Gammaproteobacteria bacterium]